MTTTVSRRRAIGGGIAGAVVLAAGGLVWRAWDRGAFSVGQGAAYEPWRRWREERQSGPMGLVQAGILAANAHNAQPWRFQVSGDRIALHADPARHLGSFDPFRREMHLSLGCAVENMVLAAQAQGLAPSVEMPPGPLPPNTGTAPAAVISFAPGERSASELFDAIARRHTNRAAYDPARTISQDLQSQLQRLAAGAPDLRVFLFAGGAERTRLGELIVSTTETIISDHEMAADSARWFRLDWDSLQRHRDGITLDTVGLPPLINAIAKIMPPVSQAEADRQWLAQTRDMHVPSAALLGMIAVRDLYDRPTALLAGRLWQRMHLWAAARGLSAQPLNQPVEIVDRERQRGAPPRMAEELAKLTGDAAWRPTFVFRLGYSDFQAKLSPRRPLEAVVA